MPRHRYEVGIYNAQVRKAIEAGGRHPDLYACWAETHYIEFDAEDEAHARAAAERRFPANAGYVITGILKMSDAT